MCLLWLLSFEGWTYNVFLWSHGPVPVEWAHGRHFTADCTRWSYLQRWNKFFKLNSVYLKSIWLLQCCNSAGGWTTTALALLLAQQVLNPSLGYGARPLTSGVPRIAVLITDGRSNFYSIRNIAPSLRNSGVQVINGASLIMAALWWPLYNYKLVRSCKDYLRA